MTIILQHSGSRELNRVEYRGPISHSEMHALGEFQLGHPDWLTYDFFSLIAASADFLALTRDDLDAFVVKYPGLFERKDLLIFRRAAWVSHSPQAQAHLDHWISQRNKPEGQTQEARQFETYAEAAAWLSLPDSAVNLETGEGFTELARLDRPGAA